MIIQMALVECPVFRIGQKAESLRRFLTFYLFPHALRTQCCTLTISLLDQKVYQLLRNRYISLKNVFENCGTRLEKKEKTSTEWKMVYEDDSENESETSTNSESNYASDTEEKEGIYTSMESVSEQAYFLRSRRKWHRSDALLYLVHFMFTYI